MEELDADKKKKAKMQTYTMVSNSFLSTWRENVTFSTPGGLEVVTSFGYFCGGRGEDFEDF